MKELKENRPCLRESRLVGPAIMRSPKGLMGLRKRASEQVSCLKSK